MSKDDADWFRIAVHNLSRPCEVDYKCGPDRKCRIHEDSKVAQLQKENKRLRAEIEWRKMREGLVDALLVTYRCMCEPDESAQEKIVEAAGALFDFDTTYPKP